ncbi:MAG: hypothetical protein F6J95_011155 [Leptolyngbya sp. SIO1E4]|nr:hypothetical protein [Leptolyngbya sp. SIO1E4]
MDRTLLPLLLLSMALVTMLAPHATLTLTAIIALSALATWGAWAVLQSFGKTSEAQSVIERHPVRY